MSVSINKCDYCHLPAIHDDIILMGRQQYILRKYRKVTGKYALHVLYRQYENGIYHRLRIT